MDQIWRHDNLDDPIFKLLVEILNQDQVEWSGKDFLVLLPVKLFQEIVAFFLQNPVSSDNTDLGSICQRILIARGRFFHLVSEEVIVNIGATVWSCDEDV